MDACAARCAAALVLRHSTGAAGGGGAHHATLLALGHLRTLLEDVDRGEGIGDHGSLRAWGRGTAVSERGAAVADGRGARAEGIAANVLGVAGLSTQVEGVLRWVQSRQRGGRPHASGYVRRCARRGARVTVWPQPTPPPFGLAFTEFFGAESCWPLRSVRGLSPQAFLGLKASPGRQFSTRQPSLGPRRVMKGGRRATRLKQDLD